MQGFHGFGGTVKGRNGDKMSLKAISPIDGRYKELAGNLSEYFSEFALIKNRVGVETRYLIALSGFLGIAMNSKEKQKIMDIHRAFSEKDAERVKGLETTLNHDIKAVEVLLRGRVPKNAKEYVHFCLTSEDVNSIAAGVSINGALHSAFIPCAMGIVEALSSMAYQHRNVSMLSRTHGQPASPTTMGKELANYSFRLRKELERLFSLRANAKLSGATGNYNAFYAAYPKKDWETFAKKFVESFGLEFCPMSTQVAPHDRISEILDCMRRINSVGLDLSKNAWLYCSIGYLSIRKADNEVGSSTMPHKINPIDFENAEGNFELSNSLLAFMSTRLQLSRFQRDLSDSTIKRNYGVAFGHSVIAMKSLLRGLGKVTPDSDAIRKDLEGHEEVISEAVQIILRRDGVKDAYESVKSLTRGVGSSTERLLRELEIPESAFSDISSLKPSNYTGIAAKLATTEAKNARKFLAWGKRLLKQEDISKL